MWLAVVNTVMNLFKKDPALCSQSFSQSVSSITFSVAGALKQDMMERIVDFWWEAEVTHRYN
jgi:hypothetical protein